MKSGKYILLSAILLAGGCSVLEKQELEKKAFIEGYKRGFKSGIEEAEGAGIDSFADYFGKHLISDQLYLMNLEGTCNILAEKYEKEGDEKQAEFYRMTAIDARIELLRIEKYFKDSSD